VQVSGRADWVGGLVLKRDQLPTAAQASTARVISAVDADVQRVRRGSPAEVRIARSPCSLPLRAAGPSCACSRAVRECP
jgi:hypothetical protein